MVFDRDGPVSEAPYGDDLGPFLVGPVFVFDQPDVLVGDAEQVQHLVFAEPSDEDDRVDLAEPAVVLVLPFVVVGGRAGVRAVAWTSSNVSARS
nr:hypothetical protein [Herbidospora solisilvae]